MCPASPPEKADSRILSPANPFVAARTFACPFPFAAIERSENDRLIVPSPADASAVPPSSSVVDAAVVNAFERDGAVCLRGVFRDWVDLLRAGVAANEAETRVAKVEKLLDQRQREADASESGLAGCRSALRPAAARERPPSAQ